jgi:glycosyltransferase involved in cell wall biosynthesis
MPCVVLEALCSGLPVIASHVGGIPEVVRQENGILVEPGNEVQLLDAMKMMMANRNFYDRLFISKVAASEFSYETVGQKICSVYSSFLTTKL